MNDSIIIIIKDYSKPIFWIRFSLKFLNFIYIYIHQNSKNKTIILPLLHSFPQKKYSQFNYIGSELHNQGEYSKKEFGMSPGRGKKL